MDDVVFDLSDADDQFCGSFDLCEYETGNKRHWITYNFITNAHELYQKIAENGRCKGHHEHEEVRGPHSTVLPIRFIREFLEVVRELSRKINTARFANTSEDKQFSSRYNAGADERTNPGEWPEAALPGAPL